MMGQFEGFRRASGRPGVRNLTLVLSVTGLTTPAARRIGTILKGVTVLGTPFGSGVLGRDREVQRRALAAFASHPNVGAVVVIGADQPVVDLVAGAAAAAGRLVEAICFDDCGHDVLTLTDRAVRVAAGFVRELSLARREPLPGGELLVGLECGRSDPSSGLVANPLLGVLVDRLVDAGGAAIFGETTEWIGAEGPLLARAATPEVADAIGAAAAARERMAVTAGIDLTYNNPSTTNIEAGLSSIEEKSLGAIAKGGSRPIRGVIDYAAAAAGTRCLGHGRAGLCARIGDRLHGSRGQHGAVHDRRRQQLCERARADLEGYRQSGDGSAGDPADRFRCEPGLHRRGGPGGRCRPAAGAAPGDRVGGAHLGGGSGRE